MAEMRVIEVKGTPYGCEARWDGDSEPSFDPDGELASAASAAYMELQDALDQGFFDWPYEPIEFIVRLHRNRWVKGNDDG